MSSALLPYLPPISVGIQVLQTVRGETQIWLTARHVLQPIPSDFSFFKIMFLWSEMMLLPFLRLFVHRMVLRLDSVTIFKASVVLLKILSSFEVSFQIRACYEEEPLAGMCCL